MFKNSMVKRFLAVVIFLLLASPSFSAEKPKAGKASEPAKAEKKQEIKRIDTMIAVFDLDITGGVTKDNARLLSESIRRDVVMSGKYEVIDRGNMNKILGEQKFQLSGCVSGQCIVEAGQLLGAGKLVAGSIGLIGKTYYLTLSIINVETGKIEAQSEDKCKCELDELIDASKRLTAKLMGENYAEPVKESPQKSFSLEDLEKNMKKEKAEWDKKTEQMKLAYKKVEEYEKKENISHEIKANAWKHFADAFKEDIPNSTEDDSMRQKAKTQLEHWQKMAKAKGKPLQITDPLTGMEFVFVGGGCYQMGDGRSETPLHSGTPKHEICIDDFYMGKYEVTVGQFRKFVNETSYKTEAEKGDGCRVLTVSKWRDEEDKNWRNVGFSQDENHPVACVSWDDAIAFANWLKNKTGKNYKLPTEAEWEYAARSGGKNEKYSGTSNESELTDYAWYSENSGKKTHPVGQKKPNGIGIYDMSGNAYEWVNDWYDGKYYKNSPKNNPTGPSSGKRKVQRGGSWNNGTSEDFGFLEASYRGVEWIRSRSFSFDGFRLVLPVR